MNLRKLYTVDPFKKYIIHEMNNKKQSEVLHKLSDIFKHGFRNEQKYWSIKRRGILLLKYHAILLKEMKKKIDKRMNKVVVNFP